ncbi:hypothetical protein HDU77_006170 [Chytriomyces hyalinus]|nr:hypothetical protein HDU77_006170 [Chytriomyces hyalinus]
MDSASTCFSLCVVTYDGLDQSTAQTLARTTTSVQRLVDSLSPSLTPRVALRPPEPLVTHTHGRFEVNYACAIAGQAEAVSAARTLLLAANPTTTTVTLKTNKRLILNHNDEMKPFVKSKLDAIMAASNTQITCQESSSSLGGAHLPPPPSPSLSQSSNGSTANQAQQHSIPQQQQQQHAHQPQQHQPNAHQNTHLPDRMDVEIMGTWADIEHSARLQTLIFLDELNGFTSKSVELAFESYPIITGRKRAVLNRIMEDSGGANIYLPNPLAVCVAGGVKHLISHASTIAARNETEENVKNCIHVTGPASIVDMAISKIQHLMATKKQSLIRKQVRLIRRKIDWLLTSKRDQVRKIMYDNGVHLQIPPLGSASSSVAVIGDNTIYIERAIRALMELVCEFYMATIHVDPSTPTTALSSTKTSLPKISQSARCEIITNNQGLEIYGTEFAVKTAVRLICELGVLSSHIREIKFRLELPLEHKEFINGKKSGKINKITKSCGCNIVFHEDLNEYNMVIDVMHQGYASAMEGLKMLEDELPAEMSFFIPETYHKRIIGVGGKNIQRIMKKHGVYVKFSNAEEFALLGGYHENKDNVIARTPAKNSENLDLLKEAVFEVVAFQSDVSVSLSIPRVLHRSVKGQHGLVVSGIERGFGCKIVWPDKESGSDDIKVVGQETAVLQAKAELLNLVPDVNSFPIPYSNPAIHEIQSDEFRHSVKDALQRELGAEIYINTPDPQSAPLIENSPPMGSGSSAASSVSGGGGQPSVSVSVLEITFIVYSPRGTGAFETVKKRVFEFLDAKQVSVKQEPKPEVAASFAKLSPPKTYDSFQHFNSKLLSSVASAAGGEYSYNTSYSLFEPPAPVAVGSAGTNSGNTMFNPPNLKNVFENAGGVSGHAQSNNASTNNMPPRIQTSNATSAGTLHHYPLQQRSQAFAPMSAGVGMNLHSPFGPPLSGMPMDARPWPQSAHPSSTFSQVGGGAAVGNGMMSAGANHAEVFGNGIFAHSDFSPVGVAGAAFGGGPRSALPVSLNGASVDGQFMFGGDSAGGDASPMLAEQFSGMQLNRNIGVGSGSNTGPEEKRKMSISKLSIGESEADNENVTFGAEVIWQLLYMDSNQSNQLDVFLTSLDLASHIGSFKTQLIDFNTLLTFNDADLIKVGLKAFGARRRLINAIRRFNQEKFARHSNQQFSSSIQSTGSSRQQPQQQRQQDQGPQGQLPPVPQSPLQHHIHLQQQQQQQQPPHPAGHSNFLYNMHNATHSHQQQQLTQPPHQLLTPSSTMFDFTILQQGGPQQLSPTQKPLMPPPGLVIPQQQPGSGHSAQSLSMTAAFHTQYQQQYPHLGGIGGVHLSSGQSQQQQQHHHQQAGLLPQHQLPSPAGPSSPVVGSYSNAARGVGGNGNVTQ